MEKDEIVEEARGVLRAGTLGSRRVSALMNLSKDIKELNQTANAIKDGSKSAQLVDIATRIEESISSLKNEDARLNEELKSAIEYVGDQVAAIEFSPNISVKSPAVSVPAINVEPLRAVLQEYFVREEETDEKFDLGCYRAQDLDNPVDGLQYVGMLSPEGKWYIMENDIDNDSLRYKFGNERYAENWNERGSFDYKLLNEAINEIKA